MASSFKRSEKLKANVIKHLIPLDPVNTGITYPISRATNYLIRITKGLIRHHHPEVDCKMAKFEVTMINPTQDIVDTTLSKLIYDERGDRVFRYWRAFVTDDLSQSIWVYVFYDALMFLVEVKKPES